jgi:hypothetical protein
MNQETYNKMVDEFKAKLEQDGLSGKTVAYGSIGMSPNGTVSLTINGAFKMGKPLNDPMLGSRSDLHAYNVEKAFADALCDVADVARDSELKVINGESVDRIVISECDDRLPYIFGTERTYGFDKVANNPAPITVYRLRTKGDDCPLERLLGEERTEVKYMK